MRQLCRVGDLISARIESIVCSILGRPASQKNQISVRLAEARSGVKSRSHWGPTFRSPRKAPGPELDVPYPSHYRSALQTTQDSKLFAIGGDAIAQQEPPVPAAGNSPPVPPGAAQRAPPRNTN